MVKCGDNIQCMFEIDICNSHPVCSDGSDEDPQVCSKGKYCVKILMLMHRFSQCTGNRG